MARILLIGSGGREHAIAWRLRQSKSCDALFIAPGNVGMRSLGRVVDIAVDNIDGLIEFVRAEKIDLTVVGPEYPLSLGIVDAFRAAGLAIFGPTKAAAQLESSKNFAKEVMVAAQVPTARYTTVTSQAALEDLVANHELPLVLKADGLAAGKGVVVCMTKSDVAAAIPFLFGELKATQVVVEQFLSGVEASYIVATDGSTIVPLAASHDYKRIYDNDQGPNTGGMGTVSPTPRLSAEQEAWINEHIIRPVLGEMQRRGTPYSGFLYAGVMISPTGEISVIEFNARLGDPETQVIMRRMQGDLVELLRWMTSRELSGGASAQGPAVSWSSDAAVCVVLAADNYPAAPRSGDEITGINLAESLSDVVVFHAGTRLDDAGRLVTAGGRVLNVTATGRDLTAARALAYKAADMIQFRGRQIRRDIGVR